MGSRAGVNDARIGQRCVNEAGKSEVRRQLICNAGRAGRHAAANGFDIECAEPAAVSTLDQCAARCGSNGGIVVVPQTSAMASFKVTRSPSPLTLGWLARICSTKLVPQRGIPRMNIGSGDGSPTRWWRAIHLASRV